MSIQQQVKSFVQRTARKATTRLQKLPYNAAYYDDEGNWHAYVMENNMLYVMTPPQGQLAVDYALHMAQNMSWVKSEISGTECGCHVCGGTGKFGAKNKCYPCNGKGWMSPIDMQMNAKYKRKQAAAKAAATRKKRKDRAA
jgi:hypothetical protein